ncbi:MAG: hypothetical protein IPO64_11915 [Bacteroidetes bacterium]|nr:hypothetical protein [Bacteroidota bacterium]
MAYTFEDGLSICETGIAAGLDIDHFAPRLSFLGDRNESFYGNCKK